jgi:ribonuclease III
MAVDLQELQRRLHYQFRSPALLALALTHASAGANRSETNERLEFLGDSVVGAVVAEYVYRCWPGADEGRMTVARSDVVSRRALGARGRELGLGEFLHVDDGLNRQTDYPNSMVADAFEAVVGAMFLDGGFDAAREFLLRVLEPSIIESRQNGSAQGYKSLLQEFTQAEGKGVPDYRILQATGPDHRRQFEAAVAVQGEDCGAGWGATKKAAERAAAREALQFRYPDWDAQGQGEA